MFKPYEILSLITFIPWALYYIGGVRLKVEDGNYSWEWGKLERKDMIVGGIWGGLIFMTFYYYFFLLITWLPIRLLMDWRREGSLVKSIKGFIPLAGLIGVMMVVAGIYWMPLMSDILKNGMSSYQNRWYQPHMLDLPLHSAHSWEMLIGILVLIGLAPFNRLAQAVLAVFVALIGYMVVGHIGMYSNFPLLHVRMVGIEDYLSKLGLVLGGLMLLKQFKGVVSRNWLVAFPVMVAVIFSLDMAMGFSWDVNKTNRKLAATTEKPMLVGITDFTKLTKDKVFLTNRNDMIAYRPMFSFICHNAHFSHPAAKFRERLKFLKLLSASKNSDFVAWMLQYNRFDAVDHIMLDNNRINVFDDNFPNKKNHIKVPVVFQDSTFQGQYFEQHPGLKEIQTAKPVPANLWKDFSRGEMRLAALFAKQDREEIRGQFSEAELNVLEDEIRIRTIDYQIWSKMFWSRYGD